MKSIVMRFFRTALAFLVGMAAMPLVPFAFAWGAWED